MPCKVDETFSVGGISIVNLSGLVGFSGFEDDKEVDDDDDGASAFTGGNETGTG